MAVTWGPDWSASLRRGSETELEGWLALALAAADAADIIALRHFRRDLSVSRKPDRTFVTQADREIEQRLRERILSAYPDHGLVGEEYGSQAADAAVRWYVDPIDGTHNYLRGIPLFATLLAVERDGEVQVGVISAPALGSRWYAWRGGGAWAVNSGVGGGGPDAARRLGVSNVTSIGEAQVLYGDGPWVERSGVAPGFRGLLFEAWRSRGFGDFWGYALVAEGAAEAMVEVGLAPWDVAAPLLLVEEAGGRLTDLAGGRSLTGRDYLATNGHLHDAVRRRLLEAGPGP